MRRRELKLAVQFIILFGVFNVCFLPTMIIFWVDTDDGDSTTADPLRGVSMTLFSLNLILNPIGYLIMNHAAREEIKSDCLCLPFVKPARVTSDPAGTTMATVPPPKTRLQESELESEAPPTPPLPIDELSLPADLASHPLAEYTSPTKRWRFKYPNLSSIAEEETISDLSAPYGKLSCCEQCSLRSLDSGKMPASWRTVNGRVTSDISLESRGGGEGSQTEDSQTAVNTSAATITYVEAYTV